eukprot:scaffold1988_cov48-Cyclotella_meneghiniana.AAC.3
MEVSCHVCHDLCHLKNYFNIQALSGTCRKTTINQRDSKSGADKKSLSGFVRLKTQQSTYCPPEVVKIIT